MIKSPYILKKNFSKLKKYNNNFYIKIYKKLYLCRGVEELIQTFYPENKIKNNPRNCTIGWLNKII